MAKTEAEAEVEAIVEENTEDTEDNNIKVGNTKDSSKVHRDQLMIP
jgi:hypothetical protein